MIHIAAKDRSAPERTDTSLSERLAKPLPEGKSHISGDGQKCAFLGFAKWRDDSPLADFQVFVARDGQAKFLDGRKDLVNHGPEGFGWGYSGTAAAQLAVAMLMEIFNDWKRVQPIYLRFKDVFVAKLPQHTNWTADGTDILAIALNIEADNAMYGFRVVIRPSNSEEMPDGGSEEQTILKNKQVFLKAVEAFRNAAYALESAWDVFEGQHPEETPVVDSYPFAHSFDELVSEIDAWLEDIQKWAAHPFSDEADNHPAEGQNSFLVSNMSMSQFLLENNRRCL